ncbi:crAss001_48 related protein [Cetobacterium sp.]|uniref:crAss001_48 related protein n=1 Tax=Cetobacterium sp. TaxID=2071632 RepID=UPI003F32213A
MKNIKLLERELEFITKNVKLSQKLIEEHESGRLSILDKTQINLLSNQIDYMKGYIDVLEQRIEYDKSKVGGKNEK